MGRHSITTLVTVALAVVTLHDSSSQIVWERSAGPLGGVPRALIELADGTVVVGTQGGLFKSLDSGATWAASNGTSPIEWVLDLDEYNGELYVTGMDRKAGLIRIMKTTDSGESWTEVPGVAGVVSAASDPTARLAVGPSGMFVIGITPTATWVAYRSTDGGQNWEGPILSLGILDFDFLLDVTLTPSGALLVGSTKLIRRSTNNGDSWTDVHPVASSYFVRDAAGTIYAGHPEFAEIYSSSDDGVTWTQIYDTGSLPTSSDGVLSLAAGNGGEVYAGLVGQGVAGTTDGGATWTQLSNGFAGPVGLSPHARSRAVLKLSSGGLLAGFVDGYNSDGSVGGLYSSSDGGANWSPSNHGLKALDMQEILVHSSGDIFSIASPPTRILRSQDGGLTWSAFSAGGSGLTSIREDPATGDLYLAGVTKLLRSSDRGDTWVELGAGAFPGTVVDVAVMPDGSIVAGFSGGIRRSTDGGQTWAAATDWQADVVEASSSGSAFALRWLLGGVWRSDDNGATWSRLASDPGTVDRMAVAPNGDVYVSQGGFGLLRSSDNGATFVDATGNLPRGSLGNAPLPVQSISFDASSAVYITTVYQDANDDIRQALFSSSDGGTTWQTEDTGFEDITWVNDVAFAPNGDAYAATSSSMYGPRSPVANEAEASVPTRFALGQNYPNPFNPETRITFDLPQSADVTLTVFDVLGREVRRIVNGYLPAGTHEVGFSGASLSSGVYVYRVRTGRFTGSRQMLLVK